VPDVNILINAQDKATSKINDVSDAVKNLGSQGKGNSPLAILTGAIGTGLKVGAVAGVTAFGALGGAVAVTGIEFDNMKQQAQIAFTTMLGDGDKAKVFLDDLQKFAASTPFEFPELLQASQRLLAMGFSAEEVKPTLTAVGDAVAGLGGGGEMVGRVTTALGQMQAKGKASGEEIMQLTEAGIPAWQMLADAIGVSVPEAMKMVTAGTISSDTAISALVAGMNTKFGGLMEKQSQTFGGLFSTIKDTFQQVSGTVMQPLFELMTKGLSSIVEWTSKPEFTAGVQKFAEGLAGLLEKMITWGTDVLPKAWAEVQNLYDQLQPVVQAVIDFGAGILEIIQPITDAIGKFISWKDILATVGILIAATVIPAIVGFLVAIAPVALAVGAIVLAVATLRTAWENDWGGIQEKTKVTLDYISGRFGPLVETIKEFGPDALREIGAFVTGNETKFTALGIIWDTTKMTFGQFFADLGNTAKTASAPLLNWFETTFPGATTALKNAWGDVYKRFGEIWVEIQNLFNTGSGKVGKTLDGLKEWWADHGDSVKEIVDNFLTLVVTIIGTQLTLISNTIKMALQILNGDWKGAWETLKDSGKVVWEAIKTIWGLFVGNIGEVWKLGLGDILTNAKEKWDDIKTAIRDRIEAIFTNVKEKWESIKAAIRDRVEDILTNNKEKWESIKAAIKDRIEAIFTNIKEKWEAIKTAIRDRVEDILTNNKEKWEEIKTAIATKIASIVTDVTTKWESIKTVITTKVGEIATAVSTKWDEIKTAISTKMGEMVTSVTTKVGEILTAMTSPFTGIYEKFKEFGTGAAQGLIDGIGGMIGAAQDKVTELGNLAAQALGISLESQSPSRRFHRYGSWAGEGFVNGINGWITKAREKAAEIATVAAQAAQTVMGMVSPPIQSAMQSVSNLILPNTPISQGQSAQTPVVDALSKYLSFTRSSGDWANDFLTHLPAMLKDPLKNYFEFADRTGDAKNDWLTHLPTQIRNVVREIGQEIATNQKGGFNVYVQSTGDAVKDIRNAVELYALTYGAA